MNDLETLEAVCCLAGADSDVTVEELQLLGELATRVGIERTSLHALVERSRDDADFRRQQAEAAMADRDGTMTLLIRTARQAGSLDEGHVTMLLWRVANKLEIDAVRFEELLAAAGTAG